VKEWEVEKEGERSEEKERRDVETKGGGEAETKI